MIDFGVPFTRWQVALVSKNRRLEDAVEAASRAERQEKLSDAMSCGAQSFAGYLRAELDLEGKDLGAVPVMPRQLTAQEAHEPPLDLETELYEAWKGQIARNDASMPAYWTGCHILWLEAGRLGDDPVATFSTGSSGKRNPNLDKLTRDTLRRLGGLAHIRFTVSAFSDCPLARAYWRRRFATEAAEQSQGALTVESAHKALHRSRSVWEEVIMVSVRNLTVLNHPKARAALIAHIAATPKITREGVRDSGRRLARHGLSYSLDMLSWDELVGIAAGARPRSVLGRFVRR